MTRAKKIIGRKMTGTDVTQAAARLLASGPIRLQGRPKVSWVPLLLAGSALFWMLALGLGGWSVALLESSADELELQLPATEEPIVVHLQSWNEVRASAAGLQEGAGAAQESAGGAQDDGTEGLPPTDDEQASSSDVVGRTAY